MDNNIFNIIMKTPPPYVDFSDSKTYVGLFSGELQRQLIFAQIAIDRIENFCGEYTHNLFYDIQGLLIALANISKLLDDKVRTGKNAKRAKIRATKLLHEFNIDITKIPVIMNRDLRNTIEHYDERLDEFTDKFPNCLYLDGISAPGISVTGHPYKIGRFYNHMTKTIQFMDSTITTMSNLKIEEAKNELLYLETQIKESK